MKLFVFLILFSFSMLSWAQDQGFYRDHSLTSPIPESIAALVESNRNRLKTHFSRNHTGIEILVAEGSWSQPESLLGHAMIRLLDEDNDDLNDTVITFAQLTLNENDKYAKGLNGGYDVFPSIQSLVEALVTYSKADSRAFRRFILPATPMLINQLKKAIYQVSTVPRLLGDYKFATNNCLTSILRVLKEAGFPLYYDGLVDIPGRAEATLRSSFLLYYPAHQDLILSGASNILADLRERFDDGRAVKVMKWIRQKISFPSSEKSRMFKEEFWTWVNQLNDLELKTLHLFWPLEWQTQRARLDAALKSRGMPSFKLETLIGVRKIPRELYLACLSEQIDCHRVRKAAALRFWSESQLMGFYEETQLRWEKEVSRNNQLASPAKEKRNEILRHPMISDLLKFSNDFQTILIRENL